MILIAALYVLISAWISHNAAVLWRQGRKRAAVFTFLAACVTGADAILIAWHL